MKRKYTDEQLVQLMSRAPREFSAIASDDVVGLGTGDDMAAFLGRGPQLYVVGEDMRKVAEDVFLLIDQKKEHEKLLRTVAAIAHSGGVIGLQEREALVHLRKLTQPYFDRTADPYSTYKLIEAAVSAEETKP